MQARFHIFIPKKPSNGWLNSLTILGVAAVHLLIIVLVFSYLCSNKSHRALESELQLVDLIPSQFEEHNTLVSTNKNREKIGSFTKKASLGITKKTPPSDNFLTTKQGVSGFKSSENKQEKSEEKKQAALPISLPSSSSKEPGNQIYSGRRGQEDSGEGRNSGDREARISYQVKPPYPADARRDGVEGAVRLQVEVLSDNRVGNVQVVHSSGSALLDKSAVDTVKNKYRFEAKIHNGAPVASLVTFTVKFVLEEESW